MKNTSLFYALMALLLVGLTSCPKDKDPAPPTKTELLTAHTWKVNTIMLNGVDFTNRQEVAYFKNSEVDFKADKTYSWKTSQGNDTGVWEFNAAETTIIENKGTQGENEWGVDELTRESLKIRTTLYDANQRSYLLELYLGKKP
jgi:hypothetical protein